MSPLIVVRNLQLSPLVKALLHRVGGPDERYHEPPIGGLSTYADEGRYLLERRKESPRPRHPDADGASEAGSRCCRRRPGWLTTLAARP